MSKNAQIKLSPIERKVRKSVVRNLFYLGLSVTSIAKIMSLHVSTVSRLVEDDEDADLDTMTKVAL